MRGLVIGVVIVLLLSIGRLSRFARLKKQKIQLKAQFGQKPVKSKRGIEKISGHWLEWSKNISDDEKIDDITWNDLDMDEVFHRMNSCNSYVGEQVLYARLHNLPKTGNGIERFERLVSLFLHKENERVDMQVLLSALGKDGVSYALPEFIANLDTCRLPRRWIYRVLQLLLVLSVLPALAYGEPSYLALTVIVFLANLVLYLVGKSKYEGKFDLLSDIISLTGVGRKISGDRNFNHEVLFPEIKPLSNEFNKLSNAIGLLKMKRDVAISGDVLGILYDYIVGATLWDFTKYNQIIKILNDKKESFQALYENIGEIDAAIAVASFRQSIPFYCVPSFSEEYLLEMENIYHPLIDEPVCNTVGLGRGTIVTGSNASGKSTFVKAVAINAILAQSINMCTAKRMILPPSHVITSMAVRDDLMAGESYYIKEIKYLKRIIDNLKEDRMVLCVIDEILRGTNNEERIAASTSIMRFLNSKHCIAIVASHDIELTQILKDVYGNYHFTEKMLDKDIVFDYKIYRGASTSRNAIRLLEHVGFPNEIVAEAREIGGCR